MDFLQIAILGACAFSIFMFFMYHSELHVPFSLAGVGYAALWYWAPQAALSITAIVIALAFLIAIIAWVVENWSMIFVFAGGLIFVALLLFGVVAAFG